MFRGTFQRAYYCVMKFNKDLLATATPRTACDPTRALVVYYRVAAGIVSQMVLWVVTTSNVTAFACN